MDAIRKIEAALAAGLDDESWHVDQDSRPGMSWNRSIAIDGRDSWVCIMTNSPAGPGNRDKAKADFVAACSPAAIREVLQTLASKEAELVRLREAGKLAWRALCDAEAVLATVDPEDSSESAKLEELIKRVSACAGVLFCELRLPVTAPRPQPSSMTRMEFEQELSDEAEARALTQPTE